MTRATATDRPKRAAKEAASWDALAAALGKDVRALHRLRLKHGAPQTRDVAAWRTFIDACAASGMHVPRERTPAEIEREQCDLRYHRARAEQAEREASMAAGRMVTREQAEQAAALVRDAYIAEGEQLGPAVSALLPDLTRSQRDQVEAAVRQAWLTARTRLAKGLERR